MKKTMRILPVIIAMCLVFTFIAPAAQSAPEQSAAAAVSGGVSGREEVVYANLSYDGSVEKVYVVNALELRAAGNVTDYGEYESAQNLTSTNPITLSGDTVSSQAEAGRFYYQGYMRSRVLPWNVSISHFLNGKEVSAGELSGGTGALEMRVKTTQNEEADSSFYENYMLQISITLDTYKCENIDAPGATQANAGASRILTYTVMPGSDGDFTVKADVVGFYMEGLQITALPMSMKIDGVDTGSITDELSQLSDAISEISKGASALEGGISQLAGSADELQGGSQQVQNGLASLASGSSGLVGGSYQILTALQQMEEALSADISLSGLEQLAGLPVSLRQIAAGLDAAAAGLTELSTNCDAANAALASAIGAMPEAYIDTSALLENEDPAVQALAGAYLAQYQAIMTVKGTYQQVQPLLGSLGGTLAEISAQLSAVSAGLGEISAGLEAALTAGESGLDGIVALRSGISQLAAQYGQFHEGLRGYTGGVDALSGSYSAFNAGISEFKSGAFGALSGTAQLAAGARELADGTGDIGAKVQDAVDEMLGEYDRSGYLPPSFTSDKNTNTTAVQFVLKTAGVPQPVQESAEPQPAQSESLWDKIRNLF